MQQPWHLGARSKTSQVQSWPQGVCLPTTKPTLLIWGFLTESLRLRKSWGLQEGLTIHWQSVRATLPPSMLFADRALLHRGYSISVPKACGETVSKPLGLTLGQVYNLSRPQLTRQRFTLNHKVGVPQTKCQPWWALQVIKWWVSCRSAVWINCIEWGESEGGCWRFLLEIRPLLRSTGLQGSRGEEYSTILKLKKQSVHPILIIYQRVKGRVNAQTNS